MVKKKFKTLKADLFLQDEDQQSFTNAQIQLLTAINECGSISSAAKNIGVSYKTAWDRIDALNNLSDKPLIQRVAGGKNGGGSKLTNFGREIVKGFTELQEEHNAFVKRLGTSLNSMSDLAKFLRSTTLQTSARNQFRGKITKITRGGINTEIELKLNDSTSIVALITNDSAKKMGLKKGNHAVALIKSSWIILSKEKDIATSARNKIEGNISKIEKGQVNSQVSLDLGNEKTLTCIVTNKSVQELKLKRNETAYALFKASSVILMSD